MSEKSEIEKALIESGLSITAFKVGSSRPVQIDGGSFISTARFSERLFKALGPNLGKHPAVASVLSNPSALESMVEKFADGEGLTSGYSGTVVNIPTELHKHTLNVDTSSKEVGWKRFFCTTKAEEVIDPNISGQYYLDLCGMSPVQGVAHARAVVPRYMPRRPPGVHKIFNETTGRQVDFFNTYVPAEWAVWAKRNPKEFKALPAKPPKEIIQLLKHVIPVKEEREYFYAWTYTSLVARSFVFLTLCGAPGVGKNRLQLLMKALHGQMNASDGKKETFGANDSKFNSQMENNTLLWFDELKYGPDMEPRMKEYQNTHISIERKGVDATRSTEIFTSMVISNNYPRDNYLLFNSRKFALLILGQTELVTVMASDDIAEMSAKLEVGGPDFDVKYVAQIAKWIMRIGPNYTARWPNLEYKGPKFWDIAHASMSRWQKITVAVLTAKTARGFFPGWDEKKKAYLWSKVEENLRRKKEFDARDYRDASTVRSFFDTYRDTNGKPVFETEPIKGSILQDFWVKPITGVKELSGDLVVDLGDGKNVNLTGGQGRPLKEKRSTRPVRPTREPGTTQFQWRKIKEEWEAITGLSWEDGDDDGKKDDL